MGGKRVAVDVPVTRVQQSCVTPPADFGVYAFDVFAVFHVSISWVAYLARGRASAIHEGSATRRVRVEVVLSEGDAVMQRSVVVPQAHTWEASAVELQAVHAAVLDSGEPVAQLDLAEGASVVGGLKFELDAEDDTTTATMAVRNADARFCQRFAFDACRGRTRAAGGGRYDRAVDDHDHHACLVKLVAVCRLEL